MSYNVRPTFCNALGCHMVQYFPPVNLMVKFDLSWSCNDSLAYVLVIQTGQ